MNATQAKSARQEFEDEPSSNDDERSMPLGMGIGEGGAIDPLANAGEVRKLGAGSFVIVFVVVIACAGLWFMRTLSHVSAASGGNTEIESSIEKFLSTFKGDIAKPGAPRTDLVSGDPNNVITVLKESYTERQVPLANVQCNPFILYTEVSGPKETVVEDGAPRARTQKRALFESAASKFVVKSVIMSDEPLANISGKIVRKGDELVSDDGVSFRVAAITSEGITVVAEDAKLDLSVAVTIEIKRDK